MGSTGPRRVPMHSPGSGDDTGAPSRPDSQEDSRAPHPAGACRCAHQSDVASVRWPSARPSARPPLPARPRCRRQSGRCRARVRRPRQVASRGRRPPPATARAAASPRRRRHARRRAGPPAARPPDGGPRRRARRRPPASAPSSGRTRRRRPSRPRCRPARGVQPSSSSVRTVVAPSRRLQNAAKSCSPSSAGWPRASPPRRAAAVHDRVVPAQRVSVAGRSHRR